MVADDCEDFKDRSQFVKLPKALHLCDEVHFVLRDLDEIDPKEYSFTVGSSAVSDTVQFVTEIGTYGFWVGESPREFAPDYDDFYHWYKLGETVFKAREEAEQVTAMSKIRRNDGKSGVIIIDNLRPKIDGKPKYRM